jgi:regulator of sigma E protease
MRSGDKIIKIDNHRVSTFDDITLRLALKHKKKTYDFTVLKPNGKINTYKIKPVYDKKSDRYIFGITQDYNRQRGILSSLRYACIKFVAIIKSMIIVIVELIRGNLSISALSGPIGVYSVTKVAAKTSFESVLYLMAYLSINLGFVNILPFPAFDGGRVFLLIIERIRGKKLNPKIENTINTIGFALLMLLMIIISIKDVINLFI